MRDMTSPRTADLMVLPAVHRMAAMGWLFACTALMTVLPSVRHERQLISSGPFGDDGDRADGAGDLEVVARGGPFVTWAV